jgi:hypothetical protein
MSEQRTPAQRAASARNAAKATAARERKAKAERTKADRAYREAAVLVRHAIWQGKGYYEALAELAILVGGREFNGQRHRALLALLETNYQWRFR